MSFKMFLCTFLLILAGYCGYAGYRVAATLRAVQPVTLTGIQMGHAGPAGLARSFYIKSLRRDTDMLTWLKKSAPITRTYVGLTLSRLLLPVADINRAGTVTFYALPPDRKGITVHFAATAGRSASGPVRLVIDVCSYVIHSLILLHMLLFILFIFLPDLYRRIIRRPGVKAAAAVDVYKGPGWSGMLRMMFALFFLTMIL